MKICCRKGWKYLFTHKATRQKLLDESYEWIREGKESTRVSGIGKEKGEAEYINHVEEAAGKETAANLFCYSYKREEKGTVTYRWLTNIEITEKNVEEMIGAARGRWKMENRK